MYNLIGTLNSETVFKVTENGDNHHHFVVYNINIYDSDNPDADIKCSAKVTDADDREIKVTDYKFESEFEENGEKVKVKEIRKNFILKYEKGCRYDISVKHEDPAYVWRKCRVGYWDLEYAFKDGYLMPSFKKDSFNLSMVSEGLLWHLPCAELYCVKDRVTYKFRYPKDLENFRICQQNDAAYQRFIPMDDEKMKDKYNIENWSEEDSDPSDEFNEVTFTSLPHDCEDFILTGGGRYLDEKTGRMKTSKYLKTVIYAQRIAHEIIKAPVYTVNFTKKGEKPPRYSKNFGESDSWHGDEEHNLLTTLKDEG